MYTTYLCSARSSIFGCGGAADKRRRRRRRCSVARLSGHAKPRSCACGGPHLVHRRGPFCAGRVGWHYCCTYPRQRFLGLLPFFLWERGGIVHCSAYVVQDTNVFEYASGPLEMFCSSPLQFLRERRKFGKVVFFCVVFDICSSCLPVFTDGAASFKLKITDSLKIALFVPMQLGSVLWRKPSFRLTYRPRPPCACTIPSCLPDRENRENSKSPALLRAFHDPPPLTRIRRNIVQFHACRSLHGCLRSLGRVRGKDSPAQSV